MVEHRLVHRLACHHCGHLMPPPHACPECQEVESLVPVGPGVERIADEVQALFPDAKVAVVTSDTIWSPAKAAEFVGRMEAGAIDIVVGTQLVTKGYHFPNLTLVGVVDADLGLSGGDLRAAERSFQQISQVSGRAGRGEKPGRVYVQTHEPAAPVISALVSGDEEVSTKRRPTPAGTPQCPPSAASPGSSSRQRTSAKRRKRPASSAEPRRASRIWPSSAPPPPRLRCSAAATASASSSTPPAPFQSRTSSANGLGSWNGPAASASQWTSIPIAFFEGACRAPAPAIASESG
jgi:primosomal protein N' (replication factor Y)